MSAAEIDRVTALARLMRQAYPGRSEVYCIRRAAEAIGDVAVSVSEMQTAARCAESIALQRGEGHQDRVTLELRWRALQDLAAEMRVLVDGEARRVA